MILRDSVVTVRRMDDLEADYLRLHRWLNNPAVLECIEGPSASFCYSRIVEKYQPRARGEHYVIPCMMEYKGEAVGYIQYYELLEQEKIDYDVPGGEAAWGTDLFIGEKRFWNRGIGTRALRLVVRHLHRMGIDAVYIDPQVENERAVRSYEKCGFEKVKVLPGRERFENEWRDVQLLRHRIT
ncbi:GNAT family N-acetyltransferase [Alteribacter lacisalsi]|uniref:GNAT family N-acetyltransferase n=1 Tax=Alteribacter lacisalsi TaxID=2045244 RepID=A0A2W0H8T3_9BACI|nr:GNAT family N-acetyltransferase [Alteribacter lacisalsi]PYZ97577.1 GNAT family N-acetyltransferase [Alteribacter lacisalsi]